MHWLEKLEKWCWGEQEWNPVHPLTMSIWFESSASWKEGCFLFAIFHQYTWSNFQGREELINQFFLTSVFLYANGHYSRMCIKKFGAVAQGVLYSFKLITIENIKLLEIKHYNQFHECWTLRHQFLCASQTTKYISHSFHLTNVKRAPE